MCVCSETWISSKKGISKVRKAKNKKDFFNVATKDSKQRNTFQSRSSFVSEREKENNWKNE